ncbi:MAG: TolC family protein [Sandaracinaceae bacterium]|nr:TolC family protein [Sandaracinaceae bacterium]
MRRPALCAWLSLASAAVWLPLAQAQERAPSAEPSAEPDAETDAEASTDGSTESGAEPGTEAAAEPRLMNLAACERAAERSWPGVRAARARLRAAQAQLDEAWVSPFFQSFVTAGVALAPEVRGSPIFSPDPQLPVDNPWQPVLGFNLEGAVPLWTFGKLPAARDAARAGIRAAQADRQRVRDQLRYDVRRAYFSLQLALDLRQMLDEALPQIRDHAARLEQQLADGEGEVTELDQYRLEAALAEIEAREADAERLLASTRAALSILTGVREIRIPDCPSEAVSVELRPRGFYTRRARRDRPEVRMLEAAVRARQAGLDFAEAGFFPDLALVYRFSTTYAPGITDQTNPFVIDQANYTTISAGLVLRWSLDLWGNAYRVDRASAELADTMERSREAHRGIELEVTDAYESARAAERQVQSWGRGRRAARRWFIAAGQARDVGVIETRELVDAARAYLTARFSHLSAIHAYNSALANLERSSGGRVTQAWEPPCE